MQKQSSLKETHDAVLELRPGQWDGAYGKHALAHMTATRNYIT